MRYGHGSVIALRSGLLAVEIGIPAPAGYVPVIPKYVPCNDGVWSRGPLRFCRVIRTYGPTGLEEALARSGLSLTFDPRYGALMPYARLDEALDYVSPREALMRRALSGSGRSTHVLSKAIALLGRLTGRPDELGLTGSYAMGIEAEFSDVDLVVYGGEAATRAYEGFRQVAAPVECRSEFGGLYVIGWPCRPWRRGVTSDVPVPLSWVGVPPEGLASHCPPVVEGPGIHGLEKGTASLTIPSGQETALLYPPCVITEEGVYVISFEYNAGGPLYEGGEVKVSGLVASRGRAIVLGSREFPGALELLRPRGA